MHELTKAKYTIQDAREAIQALALTCDTGTIRKYVLQIEDAERTIRIIEAKQTLRPMTRRPGTRPGRRFQAPDWVCEEAKTATYKLWSLAH